MQKNLKCDETYHNLAEQCQDVIRSRHQFEINNTEKDFDNPKEDISLDKTISGYFSKASFLVCVKFPT
jgi:hypothetical protein